MRFDLEKTPPPAATTHRHAPPNGRGGKGPNGRGGKGGGRPSLKKNTNLAFFAQLHLFDLHPLESTSRNPSRQRKLRYVTQMGSELGI